MANAAVRGCSALVVAILVAVLLKPHTSCARSLSVRPRTNENKSCPWRYNLIDDNGNTVDRCINELSITFQGTSSGGLTAETMPDRDSDEARPDSSASPPPGYKPLLGGNFYKLHSRPAPWYAAKEACEREGAHLLVVDSVEEAAVVRLLLGQRSYENSTLVHAGFYVELVSVLGEALRMAWHERWVRGDPTAPACGQMDSDGFLLAASCVDERPFVCEYEPSFTSSPAPPPSSSPAPLSWDPIVNKLPRGYEAAPGWNNSYYRWCDFPLFDSFVRMSAGEAYTICKEENAHLASFESEEEIQAILDLLQRKGEKKRLKMYVGVRPGELTTVLGDHLLESGFNRWNEDSFFKTNYKLPLCFWIDYKLFLHSIDCTDRRGSVSYLCEITPEEFLVHHNDHNEYDDDFDYNSTLIR